MPAPVRIELPPELIDVIAARVEAKSAPADGWLSKQGLADYLGCSVRWIESRTAEGMPSALIAGRRKFKPHEAETWLERAGHLERT